MLVVTVKDLQARWQEVAQSDKKILFVVGGAGSGKSKLLRELEQTGEWRYIEAKELLMEKLFEVEHDERPIEAKESLMETFRVLADKGIIIDSVEILFAPIFNLEPMKIFEELSATYPIIIGWRGAFDGHVLRLEHNSKKNYFSYEISNPQRVITLD